MEATAEVYGISFVVFCAQALGIQRSDSRARWFEEVPADVASRLSIGTGLTIGEVMDMTWKAKWKQAVGELEDFAKTDEGRRFIAEFNAARRRERPKV